MSVALQISQGGGMTHNNEEMLEYDPNRFFDEIRSRMRLKNDAAISRLLEVNPPVISKIRHGKLPIGASLLIRAHEATGLSIADLRALMGDRRRRFRIGDAQSKFNSATETPSQSERR